MDIPRSIMDMPTHDVDDGDDIVKHHYLCSISPVVEYILNAICCEANENDGREMTMIMMIQHSWPENPP